MASNDDSDQNFSLTCETPFASSLAQRLVVRTIHTISLYSVVQTEKRHRLWSLYDSLGEEAQLQLRHQGRSTARDKKREDQDRCTDTGGETLMGDHPL